ncbi:MAG: DUF2442 domain-containing protein [Elainellaceae cyanobacterium]
MKCPQIYAVQALDNATLLVEFTNQERKTYDIRPLLNRPMFAPLSSPAFFKTFQIEPGGYAIVWNADIDLSEYELWKNGVPVNQANVT